MHISSIYCNRNEKMKEEESSYIHHQQDTLPVLWLRLLPVHRRRRSLMSVKLILEFWACLGIFYFKDLIGVPWGLHCTCAGRAGLVWRRWRCSFSFDRKRLMNGDFFFFLEWMNEWGLGFVKLSGNNILLL